MSNIKYIFDIIIGLIVNNVGKFVLLASICASLYDVNYYKHDVKIYETNIYTSFEELGEEYVVFKKRVGFAIQLVDKSDGDYVKDGIYYEHFPVWQLLSGCGILAILLSVTIIGVCVEEDMRSFDYRGVKSKAMMKNIKDYEENGEIYYVFRGKLIYRCSEKTSRSNLASNIQSELIRFNEMPFLFNEFKGTQQMQRDGKLKDLLTV